MMPKRPTGKHQSAALAVFWSLISKKGTRPREKFGISFPFGGLTGGVRCTRFMNGKNLSAALSARVSGCRRQDTCAGPVAWDNIDQHMVGQLGVWGPD